MSLITFKEKYESCKTWQEKVLVVSIYHTARRYNDDSWTIAKTAEKFGVSVGLICENLRLAEALNKYPKLMKIETRAEALHKIGEYK